MQIDQLFCQIQGHEEQKMSHICIYVECLCASRWLCSECVKKQIHNHRDGFHGFSYFRTENQFMSFFKMKIQPFIELKLNSQDGNLIKYNYLKKIHQDLLNVNTKYNYVSKQEQYRDLQTLKELVKNLLDNYENQGNTVSDLNKIYFQLQNGLRFLKKDEINLLLTIDANTSTIEIQLYQEIMQYAKKYIHQNVNKNEAQQKTIISELNEASKRLLKLKDYINYQSYHFIFYDYYFDNLQLYQNGQLLSILNCINSQLKISNLQTKALIKQYYFKFRYRYIAFDSLWKYLIIYDRANLFYYLLSSNKKSIKLIKKKTLGNTIRGIVVNNINKIMIIFEKSIQIRDFKNRCVNEINFQYDSDKQLKIWSYGVIKNIIVTIIGDLVDSIYIYKDNERKPFIKQDTSEGLAIQYEQISLQSDNFFLLTQDTYEIKLWQIDYTKYQLILINRVQFNKQEYYWFSQFASDYNIVRSLNGQIQILDNNFNIMYELRYYKQFIPNKIMVSKHFLLIIDYVGEKQGFIIRILRKAKTDYDQLQY